MKKIHLLGLAIISMILQSCDNSNNKVVSTSDIDLISAQQVHDAINNKESLQLLDVRTQEEFKGSNSKGPKNIRNDFNKKVKSLDNNRSAYVYCKRDQKEQKN